MEELKLSELSKGTWFTVNAQKIKNSYKVIGRFDDDLIEVNLYNESILFFNDTKVSKIEGLQLYLLQDGRDWD